MDKKKKQSFSHIMKNNLFLLKLCFSAAPLFSVCFVIEAIRNEVVIFLEFTLGINYVLESAEYYRPFHEVFLFLVGLFLFVILGLLFNSFLYQKIQLKAMPKMKKKLKDMLYDKAKDIDLDSYDNPEFYNEFVFAISESNRQVDRAFEFISQLITSITALITVGAFYIAKDFLSLFFILFSFVMTFFLTKSLAKLTFQQKLERNPQERRRSYVNRIFYLNEYAKEIRLNPEVSECLLEQFEDTNQKIYGINKKYASKYARLEFLREYIFNYFVSDVFYISYLVYKAAVLHLISYSNVVVLYYSSGRFYNRLRMFTRIYPFIEETSLYMERIKHFLEIEPRITSSENRPVPKEAKQLELRHVSFAYDEKQGDILHDINLVIPPHGKIAFVGYNGAGKTTLIKLIMRLYDPREGEILLDGINIKEYNVEDYRNYIGAVFQDYKIYAATVQENVILDDKTDGTSDMVNYALTNSDFSQRLSTLEAGIKTNLTTEFEEDGVNLSGGESQKIAISRVFYKKCNLIILDEPSSALDPIAEYNLNHTMLDATDQKTVIFISHRLSTTRLANHIYMLEGGRIIEEGNHEELLHKGTKYADMWKAQAGQYLKKA
jgi:ATP-binding cassette subfamily B protein